MTKDYIYEYGTWKEGSDMNVKVKVLDDKFWIRLLMLGDLGFAESYMYGESTVNDLVSLVKLFVANREILNDVQTKHSTAMNIFNSIINSQFVNSIANSIHNISAHYDLGNDMFSSFLDETMTYSCAIFENEQESLKDGQLRKLHTMIRKARITSADHVLEIGTGWGSFAIEAVRQTGCKVTTLTLSIEQKKLAEDRIAEAGFTDSITVLLCDYRNIEAHHQFDKIVSIEMIEAVGHEFLPTFFKTCDQLLKRDKGILALQGITMPESRYDNYCHSVDFIKKHIFPGGHCPSVTALINAANKGSEGQLILENMENFGPHYARTLRLWRQEFLASYDELIESNQNPVYDDVFKRKWEYYFAYCEGAFITKTIGLVQMVFTRINNTEFLEGVPL
ncbi:cyclopropane-fatty-acyl-phospholipid synthase [Basidiobolus meristosporus CBS 931.73]|uniref:Cyclopropane-fatty-acyl-phospholipid synthase n=1 Tax=Basidiobolus meristosporus CBS 931.73 TaxID=1314790 RepID=A0A1Y1ZC42_9FUNG|nr:cyclopropane-fatty-acyl-phospholipid synthase [Basidiobolus meristosporus CBS 931.73]|eukprot:ORY07714.1 cyclopropane-fatty-acyl-phospholipid synthase [Basidiobolus meristosporus CBS 931.73]